MAIKKKEYYKTTTLPPFLWGHSTQQETTSRVAGAAHETGQRVSQDAKHLIPIAQS